jgi:hypothetical protein
MSQAFRTSILSGYFDCRIYRQGVAKENRQMKPEGDTIGFAVGFAEYPQEIAKNGAADYIRESVVNGLKRWYVTFKVGRICRFFDKDGKHIDRPLNADLDGKRWDACIQYKVLNGDAAKLQPRGLWADAVQIKPADEITFAPMDCGTTAPTTTTDDWDSPLEPLGDEPPM